MSPLKAFRCRSAGVADQASETHAQCPDATAPASLLRHLRSIRAGSGAGANCKQATKNAHLSELCLGSAEKGESGGGTVVSDLVLIGLGREWRLIVAKGEHVGEESGEQPLLPDHEHREQRIAEELGPTSHARFVCGCLCLYESPPHSVALLYRVSIPPSIPPPLISPLAPSLPRPLFTGSPSPQCPGRQRRRHSVNKSRACVGLSRHPVCRHPPFPPRRP